MIIVYLLQYITVKQLTYLRSEMIDDIDSIMALFNNEQSNNSKKLRSKKQSYLLKFQLFTLIFQKKGSQNFNQIVNNIRIAQYGMAVDIFRQQKQRCFTYIIKGLVMVFVQKADDTSSPPTLYKKMGQNQYFGEKLSYGTNDKLHSAKSVAKTYVFQLDLQTFYKTFSGHFKYHQLKQKVQFLSKIWVFRQIRYSQIQRILLLSKAYKYIKNTILFRQGQIPQAVYIVIDGELTLYKKDPQNPSKNLPFMILSKGEVCSFQQLVSKNVMQCGGVITSSLAVLLKINSRLFLDVFGDRITHEMIDQRNQVKQKLIQVKSKRSITLSLKKLNQTKSLMQQQNKKRKTRHRFHTTLSQLKRTPPVFDISQSVINLQDQLKNNKLRQFALIQLKKKEQMRRNTTRLSTLTNQSFTNDKQLLLDYLVRKQKKQLRAQQNQQVFRATPIYISKQLIVQQSSAVKNQKRRLRQSRKRNTASMPILM